MTYSATVTSKGTITLPARVRKELNIKTGDRLSVVRHNNTITIQTDTYEQDLQNFRDKIQGKLKNNGTWGTPFEKARAAADLVRANQYTEQS